eukprot:239375-Prymnesium_polylepis.2
MAPACAPKSLTKASPRRSGARFRQVSESCSARVRAISKAPIAGEGRGLAQRKRAYISLTAVSSDPNGRSGASSAWLGVGVKTKSSPVPSFLRQHLDVGQERVGGGFGVCP